MTSLPYTSGLRRKALLELSLMGSFTPLRCEYVSLLMLLRLCVHAWCSLAFCALAAENFRRSQWEGDCDTETVRPICLHSVGQNRTAAVCPWSAAAEQSRLCSLPGACLLWLWLTAGLQAQGWQEKLTWKGVLGSRCALVAVGWHWAAGCA